MTIAEVCILLAIIVYLAGMLGVGFWFARKNNSVDDFYLGGRKLGPFVTAMSAEASDMSSWLLMGLPGVAYLTLPVWRKPAGPPSAWRWELT